MNHVQSHYTGTGKTYVSCALAQQACRKGYRAMYRRAPRFFDELRLARADGSYPRLLARVARIDVLVIDDFAIAPVTETERRDLLEGLEDRYAMRATVISSQLPPGRWREQGAHDARNAHPWTTTAATASFSAWMWRSMAYLSSNRARHSPSRAPG